MENKPQDEWRRQVTEIIESPTRTTIGTSDIRVGMWSTTCLNEKVGDIVELMDSLAQSEYQRGKVEVCEEIRSKIELLERPGSEVNFEENNWSAGFNAAVSIAATIVERYTKIDNI